MLLSREIEFAIDFPNITVNKFFLGIISGEKKLLEAKIDEELNAKTNKSLLSFNMIVLLTNTVYDK